MLFTQSVKSSSKVSNQILSLKDDDSQKDEKKVELQPNMKTIHVFGLYNHIEIISEKDLDSKNSESDI